MCFFQMFFGIKNALRKPQHRPWMQLLYIAIQKVCMPSLHDSLRTGTSCLSGFSCSRLLEKDLPQTLKGLCAAHSDLPWNRFVLTVATPKIIRQTKVALPEIGLSGRPWPSFSNFLPTSFTVESMSVTTAALDEEDRRKSHRRRHSRGTRMPELTAMRLGKCWFPSLTTLSAKEPKQSEEREARPLLGLAPSGT